MNTNNSLFLATLFSVSLFGAHSVVFNGSYTGAFTIPNSAPFTSLNATSQIWDFRFHNWTYPMACTTYQAWGSGPSQLRFCPSGTFGKTLVWFGPDTSVAPPLIEPPGVIITSISTTNPAVLTIASAPLSATMVAGGTVVIGNATGSGCSGLNAPQTIISVTSTTITIAFNATGCTYTASSGEAYTNDFLMRIHRDLVLSSTIIEVWNVDGTAYSSSTVAITSVGSANLPLSVQLGDASSKDDIAFSRWYSGTLTIRSKPPWGTACNITGLTCLGDWEFESNGNDSSGNVMTITYSLTASYVTTPTYNPACNAGPQQSLRTGTTAQLDGSLSFPLDGGATLTYLWAQGSYTQAGISSQSPAFSSTTVSQPTVTSLISDNSHGPFNVTLQVTDGSSTVSTCGVHDGVVNTDSLGNISYNNAQQAAIIGPTMRFGASTLWPWLDIINKQWADRLGGFQGQVVSGGVVTDFVDGWNTAATGTVDATNGSTAIVGHGTSFQSIYCGGPGNTTPTVGIQFVGWYTYTLSGGGGGTGRRAPPNGVAACPSQTSLTLNAAWNPPTQTGMNYSVWTNSGLGSWINGSANINYYDNVLAFYTLYFRSGIEDYLGYARWLADRWWTMPYTDRGNPNDCESNGSLCNNGSLFPRIAGYVGMYLRAIDQDIVSGTPGSSAMWAGIRQFTDGAFRYAPTLTLPIGDLRETAYQFMFVALCGAYDPDSTHRAACLTDLAAILSSWQNQRQPDGHWQAFTGTYTNVQFAWPDAANSNQAGTVTVAQGSSTVTLVGGTWTAGQFPENFFSVSSFTNTATRDSRYYAATFVDSTHATISPAYVDNCAIPAGNSCSGRNWVLSLQTLGYPIGFGAQPYMIGIAGHMFNQMYQAFSTNLGTYASQAALAKSYVVDTAKWVAKSTLDGSGGTDPATRGALYAVGFGVCTPGAPDGSDGCRCGPSNSNCASVTASRENMDEALGDLAIGYNYSGSSSALKTAIDNVFSACYAKFSTDSGYDGTYCQDYDPLNDGAFWLTNNSKWLGFTNGTGRNSAYLSTRGVVIFTGGSSVIGKMVINGSTVIK